MFQLWNILWTFRLEGREWKAHPIHFAEMLGCQSIVRKSLDHGADVFATTGIHTERGYYQDMDLLLAIVSYWLMP
jgi:hypothetical protein